LYAVKGIDEYSGTTLVSEKGLMNLFGKLVTGIAACEILGILAGIRDFILHSRRICGLKRQNACLLLGMSKGNEGKI